MKKLFLLLSAIFTLSACGTLEVSIYQTPTPDEIDPWSAEQQAWGRNLIFSSYWAQHTAGGFEPMRLESVAGRPALVVVHDQDLMWVDVETGIILKMQYFGKGGYRVLESMVLEYVVMQVQFDIPNLPDELFSVSPPAAPDFSDVTGQAPR